MKPTRPQRAAGTRMEARVSVPSEPSAMPVTSEIAEPPLDPPGIRESSQGLLDWGVVTPSANSWVTALPAMAAPAARSLATAAPSDDAGAAAVDAELPRVGMPATSMTSLIETGMPARGPGLTCRWPGAPGSNAWKRASWARRAATAAESTVSGRSSPAAIRRRVSQRSPGSPAGLPLPGAIGRGVARGSVNAGPGAGLPRAALRTVSTACWNRSRVVGRAAVMRWAPRQRAGRARR